MSSFPSGSSSLSTGVVGGGGGGGGRGGHYEDETDPVIVNETKRNRIVYLPKYSSEEIMKNKILFVAKNHVTI